MNASPCLFFLLSFTPQTGLDIMSVFHRHKGPTSLMLDRNFKEKQTNKNANKCNSIHVHKWTLNTKSVKVYSVQRQKFKKNARHCHSARPIKPIWWDSPQMYPVWHNTLNSRAPLSLQLSSLNLLSVFFLYIFHCIIYVLSTSTSRLPVSLWSHR